MGNIDLYFGEVVEVGGGEKKDEGRDDILGSHGEGVPSDSDTPPSSPASKDQEKTNKTT